MNKYLCLKASAGTGKTFSLVVRYISLLYLDENINDIVCVTFTNKATNEMEDRIIKILQNLDNEDSYLEAISKNIDFSVRELKEKRSQVYQNLLQNQIHILTIDKFLNKILRNFCWYQGINQDFEIANEDINIIKEEFINKLTQQEYENLIKLTIKENIELDELISIFNTFYQKDYELQQNNLISNEVHQNNCDKILELAFNIKNYVLNSNASKSGKNAVDFDNIKTLIQKGKTWLSKDSFCEYSFFKKIENDNIEKVFQELKSLLKEYFDYQEQLFLNQFFIFYNIYKDVKLNYIKSENQLNFQDVTTLVHNLLTNKIDSEFLYYRLDSNITHLLIDEFQDTNLIQYEIFSKIINEIFSGLGTNDNIKTFFYVGDPKQSIYRFRGANSLLFDYLYKKYEKYGLTIENLDTNYRSSQNIVDFTNSVFESLYDDYKEQKCFHNENKGYVQVFLDDDLLLNIKKSIQIMLQKGYSFEDITILAFSNNDIIKIKNYLESEFTNIQTSIDSQSLLINQPKIKAIINLIKYIYFEEDIYKANFLSLIGNNIFEEINIEKYKNIKDLLTLISTIVDDFDLNDENSLKFINISFNYKDIIDFIFNINNLEDTIVSSSKKGLKIMTIHKSKGLEFDNLIVVDRFTTINKSSKFLFDYDNITLKRIFYKQTLRENFDDEYLYALEKDIILSNIDTKNILYVAITRAKNNLFVIRKNSKSVFKNIVDKSVTIGQITSKKLKNNNKRTFKPLKINLRNYGIQTQFVKKDKKEEIFSSIESINFGLAVHYAIENLEEFKEKFIKDTLVITNNKYGFTLNENSFKTIESILKNIINDKNFQLMIQNAKITKELSLSFNNKLNIIDLLIEKNDTIIIVDYKTSKNDKKNFYLEKMQLYKEAISSIYNKPTEAYLYFLNENSVTLEKI
jgi:exodeoxyribonuclease V beta subunit